MQSFVNERCNCCLSRDWQWLYGRNGFGESSLVKQAVPLAGKYRLVDRPISNCLNSGLRQVYVLTQFNSTSLNRHINASYKFDNFSTNFVEILAAPADAGSCGLVPR